MKFRYIILTLIVLSVSGCKMELNTGLDEQTANEMLSNLLARDIAATKQVGKDNLVTLMVEEAQFSEAVQLLQSLGLPRESRATMQDVFNDAGLVSSPVQEQARMTYAQTQELESTISSLPGAISAKVHIATALKEGPFDEVVPTASVLVLMERDAIAPDLIPQIKQLVAFSVVGMDYDNVAVVVSPVPPPPPPPATEFVELAGVRLPKASMSSAVSFIAVAGLASAVVAAAATFLAMRLFGKKSEAKG